MTVQGGPTQIDVRQPVLTCPDTLRNADDLPDFLVETYKYGPIYLVQPTGNRTGDL